jgi:hypothetical protein
MSPGDIGMIVLVCVGTSAAFGVAVLKLLRSSEMQLLTQQHRPVHCPNCRQPVPTPGRVDGFLRWWGILAALFVGPPVLLWAIVKGAEFFHAIISNLGGYAG